jgi:hypothetical protein
MGRQETGGRRRQEAGGRRGMYFIILKNALCSKSSIPLAYLYKK